MKLSSPFEAGTRVAVLSGYRRETVREAYVEKVHKNGNFVLRDDKKRQQYRPHAPCREGRHSAMATGGNGWGSTQYVLIWNDATDKDIQERFAAARIREKFFTLHSDVQKLKLGDISEAAIDKINTILSKEALAKKTRTADDART